MKKITTTCLILSLLLMISSCNKKGNYYLEPGVPYIISGVYDGKQNEILYTLFPQGTFITFTKNSRGPEGSGVIAITLPSTYTPINQSTSYFDYVNGWYVSSIENQNYQWAIGEFSKISFSWKEKNTEDLLLDFYDYNKDNKRNYAFGRILEGLYKVNATSGTTLHADEITLGGKYSVVLHDPRH